MGVWTNIEQFWLVIWEAVEPIYDGPEASGNAQMIAVLAKLYYVNNSVLF